MAATRYFHPTSLTVAVLIFVGLGPFALAVVFYVANAFAPKPVPAFAFFIPFMWWMAVFTAPEVWKITVLPTLLGAVFLWGGLGFIRGRFPAAASTRFRAALTCLGLGAVASFLSWQVITLAFDQSLLPAWGLPLILLVVVPTGAIVSGFVGLAARPAP